MKNQIKLLEGLEITISKLKSDTGLKAVNYGPITLFWNNNNYEIVTTKRGKELRLSLGESRNKCDFTLKNLIDARFTSEYVFIPVVYIKCIKKGSALILV